MTLRSSHDDCAYCKTLWDWGFLDKCFTNGIRVTDIDGFVERRGHYLILETKKPSVATIPVGQQRMFSAMRLAGCFTVLIIYGHPGNPVRTELYYPIKGMEICTTPTLETIQDIVGRWYRYVNNRPPTPLQAAAQLAGLIEAFRQEQMPSKRIRSIDPALQPSLLTDSEAV